MRPFTIYGYEVIGIAHAVESAILKGQTVTEALASNGVQIGSKLHHLLGAGFEQVKKNPNCKINVFI